MRGPSSSKASGCGSSGGSETSLIASTDRSRPASSATSLSVCAARTKTLRPFATPSRRCSSAWTLPAPRRSPLLNDSAAHGVDRGLDAVFDLKLHQDVRDVVLDRFRADEELTRDLGVVLADGDQLQHLDLPVGKLRANGRGRVLARALRAQPLEQLSGDLRRDQRLPGCGRADPNDEVLDRGVLQ